MRLARLPLQFPAGGLPDAVALQLEGLDPADRDPPRPQQRLPRLAQRSESLLLRKRRAPPRPGPVADGLARPRCPARVPHARAAREARRAPARRRRRPRPGADGHGDDAALSSAALGPHSTRRRRRAPARRSRRGGCARRVAAEGRPRPRARDPGARSRGAHAGPALSRGLPRAERAAHREPGAAAAQHGRRGRGPAVALLPVLRRHRQRQDHPRELLHDERQLRQVPQGHLRPVERVGAPPLVVQQPVVPQVDRVHAGRRRHEAQQVVRGLPRPRGLLQRPLRQADQGADRDGRGAERARLHLLPLDRARAQHDGPGRLRDRVPAAARPGGEREPGAGLDPRLPAEARPGAAPQGLHEGLPPRADRGLLLVVPQGAPRRAGQRLPLVPRLQRLRQLAGLGHVGPGRALLLLPAQAAEVQRLPHAARRLQRSDGPRRQGQVAPLPRGEHRAAVRERRPRAAEDHAGLPEGRRRERGRLRARAGRGAGAAARDAAGQGRRAAPRQHVRGRGGRRQPRRSADGAPRRGADDGPARQGGGVAPPRRLRARRGRGAHPQDRPLLPGRHRRRVRRLGGARGEGLERQDHLPQRRGHRRRQGAGRSRRPPLPQPAARRARQPDQQAQRLGRALGRLRAADPAGRRRHDPLPAADPRGLRRHRHAPREGQLPQVHVVEHAVGLRRRARSRAGEVRPREVLRRRQVGLHRRHLEGLGRHQGDPGPPDHDAGRGQGRAADPAEGRARAGAQGLPRPLGARALERLRHRAAAAGRSARCGGRLPEGDRDGARLRGRLRERGARADPGRCDGRGRDLAEEGPRDRSQARQDALLPRHGAQGARPLRRGPRAHAHRAVPVPARPRRREPGRPSAVPEAPAPGSHGRAAEGPGDRPRGPAGALQPDAGLPGSRERGDGEETPGALRALQGRRGVAVHHGPVPAAAPSRQQRAPVDPRAPHATSQRHRRRRSRSRRAIASRSAPARPSPKPEPTSAVGGRR